MRKLVISLAALAGALAAAGARADSVSSGTGVPPESELRAMATNAVLRLGQAIAARDFAQFHAATAQLWQRQATPEALRQAFQSLIDQGADLSVVRGATPRFTTPPAIDGSGRLVLDGFFPTQPTRVAFTLKHVREGGEWRLVGISVRLETAPSPAASAPAPASPAAPAAIPPEGDLAALTHRSMRLFAAAVARDDFSELYAGLATAWKRQTSAGDLRSSFAAFVDKKIPLGVVDGSAPVFTAPPGIDADGLLRVTGHYPTRPIRVLFTLHFLHEESQWRLAGIEVHTKQE